MRRFVALQLLLVFSVSFFFFPSRASACSSGPPELPLRGLYLKSDLIIVGKPVQPTKWIAQEVETLRSGSREAYQYFNRDVPIAIHEVIKGAAPEKLILPDSTSRYIDEEGEVKTGAAVQIDEDETSQLGKIGQLQLFFLKKDKDDDTYDTVVTGRYDKLFEDEMELHVMRLRQLHAIYLAGKVPSKTAILEWMVSMAEDPRTRFEGSFELRDITRSAHSTAQRAKKAAAKKAAGGEAEEEEETTATTADTSNTAANTDGPKTLQPTINGLPVGAVTVDIPGASFNSEDGEDEDEDANENDWAFDPYTSDESFDAMLTPAQKERLIQAFLTVRFEYEMYTRERREDDEDDEIEPYALSIMSRGDSMLLETVSHFRDGRVAARLLAELPASVRHKPNEASQHIEYIARYFDDEDMDDLYDEFSHLDYGDDDEEITDDDVVKTYAQRRAELTQQIVARGSALMAKKK